MEAKKRKLNDTTTRIVIKSKNAGLNHEAVKELVEKLLKCKVKQSFQMEGLGKDEDDVEGVKSGVVLMFANREKALKTLNLDYKLEEVLGMPVTIAEHIDRRKRVHEFRLKDKFKDAFESDDEEKKERGPKRSFRAIQHQSFEEEVTVNKLKTVHVSHCPATMRDPKVVREKFAECGQIRNVVLRTDASGMFKGVAFIEFTSEEGATAARKMNMKLIDGNRIRVHYYNDKYAAPSNARKGAENIHKDGFKKVDGC